MNAGPNDADHDLEAASQPAAGDPDISVAERARSGDREAMAILVHRHSPAVTRLLWKFVRTQSDLEDLVQDTFLRMVKGLPRWRSEQPFSHWILRIAANTGRDYFRRHAVRRRWMVEPRADAGDEFDPSPPVEAPDPLPDPAARAAANEIKELLERLPTDDRAILTLHHLQGWGLVEIARHFGWTHTATKLRAWRARRRLREILISIHMT
ncbi:MAG: RNA polymerase sigma factor [Opitutaceae bacterium]|nr:RNA polymerase sigma factor [Opitutaceae bacterium]